MILVTHEIIGGALAIATKADPMSAFFLGLASHYIFDMIPHWHYKTSLGMPFSQWQENGKAFLKKAHAAIPFHAGLKAVFDGTSGLIIILGFVRLYDQSALVPVLLALFGSILPDILTGVSKLYPKPIFVFHTKVHLQYIHTKILLDNRPLLGIGSQVLISLIALWIAFVFR